MAVNEQVILSVELNAQQVAQRLSQAEQSVRNTRKELRELQKAGKGSSEEAARLRQQLERQTKTQKEYRRELRNVVQQEKAQQGSLKALRAELNRANAAFDGLSREQRESEQTGGRLQRRIDRLTAEIKEAERATGRFQRNVGNYPQTFKNARLGFQKFQNAIVKGAAIIAGIAATVRGLAASTEAYNEQATQEALLLNAVNGNRARANNLLAEAAVLQEEFIIGDEKIIATQQALITQYDLSNERISQLIEAAANYAATAGVDFDTALNQISKTLGGLGGELQERLPDLKNFTQEQLRSGAAIDLINEKFADAGRTLANVGTSGLDRLSNTLGDIGEQLGGAIAPAINSLADGLRELFDLTTQAGDGFRTQRIELQRLSGQLVSNKTTQEQRNVILRQINETYGEYLPNLLSEDMALSDINKNLEVANKNLVANALIKDKEAEITKLQTEAKVNLNKEIDAELKAQQALNKVIESLPSDLETGIDALDSYTAQYTKVKQAIESTGVSFERFNGRNIVLTSNSSSEAIRGLSDEITEAADAFSIFLFRNTQTEQAQSKAEEQTAKLEEEIRILSERIVEGAGSVDELNRSFETSIDKLLELNGVLEPQNLTEAQKAYRLLSQQLEGLEFFGAGASAEADLLRTRMQELTKAFGSQVAEIEKLADPESGAYAKLTSQISELETEIRNLLAAGDPVPPSLVKRFNELRQELEGVNDAFRQIKDGFDRAGLGEVAEQQAERVGRATAAIDEQTAQSVTNFFAANREKIDFAFQAINETFSLIGQAFEQNAQNRLKQIDKRTNREISAIQNSALAEEEKEKRILRAQQRADRQRAQIEKEQFRRQKKLQVAQAIASGAQAVLSILASSPDPLKPIGPLYLAQVALAAATTAAQVGIIASQKFAQGGVVPAKEGGFITGRSHEQGGVKFSAGGTIMEAEGGEIIVNKNIHSRPDFVRAISNMNAATGGKPFFGTPTTTFRRGGVITPSVDRPQFDTSQLITAIQGIRPVVAVEEINSVNSNVSAIQTKAST